jgi:hypothetical protein
MIEPIARGCAIETETLREPSIASTQFNTITLERNSVLVARFSKDSGYDLDELEYLRKLLKETFPCHQVIVWYDDVDFMVINDKGYKAERLTGLNEDSNYY